MAKLKRSQVSPPGPNCGPGLAKILALPLTRSAYMRGNHPVAKVGARTKRSGKRLELGGYRIGERTLEMCVRRFDKNKNCVGALRGAQVGNTSNSKCTLFRPKIKEATENRLAAEGSAARWCRSAPVTKRETKPSRTGVLQIRSA